jgi:cellulose synthase/poly-beta-1,6-N-acetylglucosamine synthase-like glycosyltransferase
VSAPSVSIVVETVTARERKPPLRLAAAIAESMEALASAGNESVETIVVIDPTIDPVEVDEARRRYPSARFVGTPNRNYFEAKNAGAAAANAEIVVLLDGDTAPGRDWLDAILSGFKPGIDVVAGRTRYTGPSLAARTFSIPDFAAVLDNQGAASGFNINNVAFRREVLAAHPLDARIRRNGGCFLLYNELRKANVRMVYEPRAVVNHAIDEGLRGFIRKHLDRGFEGIDVYRLDDQAIVRGTPIFRRFGWPAIPPLMTRRLALDWLRLVKHRRQMGVSILGLPYYFLVSLFTRMIQTVGAFTAVIDPYKYGR